VTTTTTTPKTTVDVKPVLARVLERLPWVREEVRSPSGRSVRLWQYKVSASLKIMGGTARAKGGDKASSSFVEVGLVFDDAHGGTNGENLADFRAQLGARVAELGLTMRTEEAGAKCYLSRRFEAAGDPEAAEAAAADLAVTLLELGLGTTVIRDYYRGLRDRQTAGTNGGKATTHSNRSKS
jgi:hypothetical protein